MLLRSLHLTQKRISGSLRRALHRTRPTVAPITSHTHPPHEPTIKQALPPPLAIDPKPLFSYTSGRWLMNDSEEHEKRSIYFSIAGLQAAVVAAVNGAKNCVSIIKLGEGEYNKAFLLTLDTTFGLVEVVAKLPHPLVGPRDLVTASEVATLEFCRSILRIPVPKVLAWSTTKDLHGVGWEYIIMEKAIGDPLTDIWDEMKVRDRRLFADKLLGVETTLFSATFNSIGSLYFKEDVPQHLQSGAPLLTATSMEVLRLQPEDVARWCIGPSIDRGFYDKGKESLDLDRGPWENPSDYLRALAERQITWLRASPPLPRPHHHPFRRMETQENPACHVDMLEKFLQISAYLIPEDERLNGSVLAHNDLHTGNIFVNREGKPDISCILDWQGAMVAPLFLQVRIPAAFAHRGTALIRTPPALPGNYEELSPKDKEKANEEAIGKFTHWAYQLAVEEKGGAHSDALYLGQALRATLVSLASDTYADPLVPLLWRFRNLLIQLVEDWPKLHAAPSPISFSQKEVDDHRQEEEDWATAIGQLDLYREFLGMRRDGWVPTEQYEAALKGSRRMKSMWLEEAAKQGLLRHEEAERLWPLQT